VLDYGSISMEWGLLTSWESMIDHSAYGEKGLVVHTSIISLSTLTVVYSLPSYQPDRVAVQSDTDKVPVPTYLSTVRQRACFLGTAKDTDCLHRVTQIASGLTRLEGFARGPRRVVVYMESGRPTVQCSSLLQAAKSFYQTNSKANPDYPVEAGI
jgi:hypothetical protein